MPLNTREAEIEARRQKAVAGDPYPFADIDYLLEALRQAEWRLESLKNRLTIDEHGTVILKDMRR